MGWAPAGGGARVSARPPPSWKIRKTNFCYMGGVLLATFSPCWGLLATFSSLWWAFSPCEAFRYCFLQVGAPFHHVGVFWLLFLHVGGPFLSLWGAIFELAPPPPTIASADTHDLYPIKYG